MLVQAFIERGLAVDLALQRLAEAWGRPLNDDATRALFVAALRECLPARLRTLYEPELDPAELDINVRHARSLTQTFAARRKY